MTYCLEKSCSFGLSSDFIRHVEKIPLSTIKFPTQKYKILYHATRVFPLPYHHPSLRRFTAFAVTLLNAVWYSGTRTVTSRTKDVKIGNVTLSDRVFSNQSKFSKIKTENVYNKHIITT